MNIMGEELGKKIDEIQVVKIIENDDGSATVVFDMDQELIKLFAEIGLRKVLMDSIHTVQDDIKNEHS